MDINEKLKQFNLKRNKQFNVGKTIDKNIWVHKQYATSILAEDEYKKFLNHVPENFQFNILRINLKEHNISFINSPDFDYSNEPLIGDIFKVQLQEKDAPILSFSRNQIKNPLIYHHKWMFVNDEYKGFDVKKSKERSLEWKNILGVNKELSNKIGRKEFWDKWLKENNLPPREPDNQKKIVDFINKKSISDVWSIYFSNSNSQSITSENTARNQIPSSFKLIEILKNKEKKILLDIGCGSGNQKFEEKLKSLNIIYHGCDPFNKSQKENQNVIHKCMNEQSDIVTLNNVLNTIPEKDVWTSILKQAKNALNPESGVLITLIYEGEKLQSEKKQEIETGIKMNSLTPIKTRDGWQNRMKAESYLEAIQKVFPNTQLLKIFGKKYIVSSVNPKLDLKQNFKFKEQKNKYKI